MNQINDIIEFLARIMLVFAIFSLGFGLFIKGSLPKQSATVVRASLYGILGSIIIVFGASL